MSFYAYKDIEHKELVLAEKVHKEEQNNNYYCINPNCNCIYRFRAYNSNKRVSHFFKLESSHHVDGCWAPYADTHTGNIDNYDFSDFSDENLLNRLLSSKKKNISSAIYEDKSTDNVADTDNSATQYIHTIRQLFSVCISNPLDTVLYDNVTIKDIFCGRKTAFFYASFIKGIKLVEARFHRYNKKTKTIDFNFPYSRNGNNEISFKISLIFEDEKLFYNIIDYILSVDRYKPMLIYADFKTRNNLITAEIKNKKQIIKLP